MAQRPILLAIGRILAMLSVSVAALLVIGAGLPDKARVNAIGYIGAGQLPVAAEEGGYAPPLDALHPDGSALVITPNQPMLVNFWATWCGPCLVEMPALQTAYQAYHDKGVRIIAVNLGEPSDVVSAWTQRFGLTFDIVIDPDRRLMDRYRVRGAPSSYFIDRRGIIRHIAYGALTSDELSQQLVVISAP